MKTFIFFLGFSLFLTSGCSKSSSNVSDSPTGPTSIVTPPPPNSNPYGDQISAGTPINLADKVNYSGLADIKGTFGHSCTVVPFGSPAPVPSANTCSITLPLVGDARVTLATTSATAASINGGLFLAFEDQNGFWATQWKNAFPGSGVQQNTSAGQTLDIIFSDSNLSVRVQGVVNNSILNGTLYYRLRQTGDTACVQQTQSCKITYPNGTTQIINGPCPGTQPPDLLTPCRSYLDPSNGQVKTLGTFSNSLSQIATGSGSWWGN